MHSPWGREHCRACQRLLLCGAQRRTLTRGSKVFRKNADGPRSRGDGVPRRVGAEAEAGNKELSDLAQTYYKTGVNSTLRTFAEAMERERLLHDKLHWLHMKNKLRSRITGWEGDTTRTVAIRNEIKGHLIPEMIIVNTPKRNSDTTHCRLGASLRAPALLVGGKKQSPNKFAKYREPKAHNAPPLVIEYMADHYKNQSSLELVDPGASALQLDSHYEGGAGHAPR
jgi:hypothetical protein